MLHYNDDVKEDRMTVVIDHIDDAGTPGKIEIGTSALTGASPPATSILVDMPLQIPSFVYSSTVVGRIDLQVPTGGLSAQAVETGTAALARILDGNGTVVVDDLEVGDSTDIPAKAITLNSTSISAGQTVTIQSGRINHAP